MKPVFQNIIAVILVCCAVTITGAFAHREFGRPRTARASADEVRTVKDWQRLAVDGRLIGSRNAPIQVVEFSDFECPYCRSAEEALADLRAQYQDRVAVVYRHMPITDLHSHAFAASLASECAADQDRFVPYHDALFASPDSLRLERWTGLARAAGVTDIARFEQCVKNETFRSRVEHDLKLAREIGVSGTPTFIFRDRLVAGTPGLARIKTWLDSALVAGQ